jgi:nucleoside-diphosphate-sugar epimerase
MSAVLITGADGYLGARIAARFARQSPGSVIAWLRASSEEEFALKRAQLEARMAGALLRYCWGDLRREYPFAGLDPAEIGTIVHAAAVTRFNVEAHLAREVNAVGTAKLLAFAGRCRSLEAVGLLSTLYASGLRPGAIEEQPFDDTHGFANHYERSKWLAEQALFERFADLPWILFRVATVIADDESGRIGRHNAVHNTLKLLYHGLISLVPGDPQTPLYFVTGDFAAANVECLMRRGVQRVIYHLAPSRAHSIALDALVETAWQVFEQSPQFAKRRLLRPVYAALESFQHLSAGVSGFGGAVLAQAIGSMTPFAPQLYVRKSVSNANLCAAATGRTLPAAGDLVRATCAQLVC